MLLDTGLILHAASVALMQFLICASLASFATLSRIPEEGLLSSRSTWSRHVRLIYSGRRHLILLLLVLEVVLVIYLGAYLIRIAGGGSAGQVFPFWNSAVLIYAVIAVLSLVAASVMGFGLALRNPLRFAVALSFPLFPIFLLLRPVTAVFFKLVSFVFPQLMREISSIFSLYTDRDEGGEGFIEENGSKLMHSIVEFGEKKVREVMVPRIDILALDVSTPLEEVRRAVTGAGHSRVPVYDGSLDRVVGILFVKDLLSVAAEESHTDIDGLAREAYFVPEGKKIDILLREFQMRKKHMAIVVDEYGGTAGIVTLEDILEEIVGEIRDEDDQETPLVREISDGVYAAQGRVGLDDLRDEIKVALPADEVDTLGGFLFNLIGRVPEENEKIDYEGMLFKIVRIDGQRIAEVEIDMNLTSGEGG